MSSVLNCTPGGQHASIQINQNSHIINKLLLILLFVQFSLNQSVYSLFIIVISYFLTFTQNNS